MARLDEWVPDLPGHCATLIYCLLTKMSALVNQIQVSKFQMLLLGKISAQVKNIQIIISQSGILRGPMQAFAALCMTKIAAAMAVQIGEDFFFFNFLVFFVPVGCSTEKIKKKLVPHFTIVLEQCLKKIMMLN